MHELSVTEAILKTVLKHAAVNSVHKILSISLQVSKLSDLEDSWIQRYFDYLSKDTVAAGALLKIERLPILVKCEGCAKSFETEPADIGNMVCPSCGEKKVALVPGRQYIIKNMEVV